MQDYSLPVRWKRLERHSRVGLLRIGNGLSSNGCNHRVWNSGLNWAVRGVKTGRADLSSRVHAGIPAWCTCSTLVTAPVTEGPQPARTAAAAQGQYAQAQQAEGQSLHGISFLGFFQGEAATGCQSHLSALRKESATEAEMRGCRIVSDETQKGWVANRKETVAGRVRRETTPWSETGQYELNRARSLEAESSGCVTLAPL